MIECKGFWGRTFHLARSSDAESSSAGNRCFDGCEWVYRFDCFVLRVNCFSRIKAMRFHVLLFVVSAKLDSEQRLYDGFNYFIYVSSSNDITAYLK